MGLSPRVRGNHADGLRAGLERGSIPASAGEPGRRSRVATTVGVYPRECGGTKAPRLRTLLAAGLSPRVRGNPERYPDADVVLRSIPASAGEPPQSSQSPRKSRVYPRECGGTRMMSEKSSSSLGLSPRVRGNLPGRLCAAHRRGSIPASAGEPQGAPLAQSAARVYPRECGGTYSRSALPQIGSGLSPRVRGNRRRACSWAGPLGSIPASAGEPWTCRKGPRWTGVYPRECGGTSLALSPPPCLWGLSPRVRGNLGRPRSPMARIGLSPRVRGNRQHSPR